MKGNLFLFLFFLIISPSHGQAIQVSEQDVQTESIFIEAIRNKLIDRHDLSIPQFRELIKKQPNNDVLWYELGFGLMKTKKYDESIDAITKAISIAPNKVSYLQLQADVFHSKQDLLSEINVYKKLQSIDPYKESYYTHWSDLLLATAKWGDAIKVLNLLEQSKGINEISSLKKASLYEQNGKLKEAEAELLKINASFPDDLKYLHYLAGFYSRIQKSDKANNIYKEILRINPGDEKANLALASVYKASGQDDQYLQSLQSLMDNSAISLDTKILELIPYLEKAIAKQDKPLINTIEKYAASLATAYKDEAKPHALYADVLSAQGRDILSYAQYQEAIKLNSSIKSVWIQYIRLARQFEEAATLLKLSEMAFDLFPNDPNLANFYAYSLIKNGNLIDARSILRQSTMMAGNNSSLLETIYSLELSLDHIEGNKLLMTEHLNKIKTINSKSSQAIKYPIDLMLAQNKNLEHVLEFALQARKDFPQLSDLDGFLGIINYKLKKYSDARSNFESSVSIPSEYSASFLETYGDTLFVLKDVEAALSAWKRAYELNPYNSKLKKKITDKTLE